MQVWCIPLYPLYIFSNTLLKYELRGSIHASYSLSVSIIVNSLFVPFPIIILRKSDSTGAKVSFKLMSLKKSSTCSFVANNLLSSILEHLN